VALNYFLAMLIASSAEILLCCSSQGLWLLFYFNLSLSRLNATTVNFAEENLLLDFFLHLFECKLLFYRQLKLLVERRQGWKIKTCFFINSNSPWGCDKKPIFFLDPIFFEETAPCPGSERVS
jgi:hypothetical protein